MGKKKSCDPGMRRAIVSLRNNGLSYGQIAKQLSISKKMAYSAVKYFEIHKTFEKVQRKKRARKTTQQIDRLIVRTSLRDPKKSSSDIQRELFGSTNLAESVSSSTIRRRLTEKGLHGRIARKKPLVSKKNRSSRKRFARTHGNWTENQWKFILWSDETKINRIGPDGRKYVRRPRRKEFDPKYTVPVVKHGGGSINVWGCFSWNGVGPIHRIEGILTAEKYREILRDVMLPWVDENLPVIWVFQQDNDPKHTAKGTKEFLQQNSDHVLEWPSCSPDLNPIEHLWGDVKNTIGKENIINLDQLFTRVKEIWEAIPVERCQSLIRSMESRCKAVIKQKGYPTKY